MATSVERLGVEVFVEGLTKFERDMGKAEGSIEGLSEETEKSSKAAAEGGKRFKAFGLTLTDLKSGVDIVVGGLKQVVEWAKKGLEFAELGAAARQVEESFERTRRELNLDVDMLRQLQEAVNNTIPAQDLMASAQTLVAGTSKDFGAELLRNLPRLAQYAKASNKLNPELGDTSFLLESIATGLKRGSPMILDNLGLVVKVGEANKVYAEMLGKSVSELTAEEKQMALLNDVMRAGDRLIEQVGGTTDSATDSFQAFTATLEDTKTEFSKVWAEFVLGTGAMEAATNRLKLETAKLGLPELMEQVRNLGELTDEQSDKYNRLMAGQYDVNESVIIANELIIGLNATMEEQAMMNEVAIDGWQRHQFELQGMQKEDDLLTEATEELTEATDVMTESTEGLDSATGSMIKQLEAEHIAIGAQISQKGELDEKNREVSSSTRQLTQEERDLEEQLTQRTKEALIEYKEHLEETKTKHGELFAATLESGEEIENFELALYKAGVQMGLGREELVLLAAATGEFSDAEIKAALETAIMQGRIEEFAREIREGKMSVPEALEQLERLKRGIEGVKGKTVKIKVKYSLPSAPPGVSGGPYQSGGTAIANQPIVVGEAGPELFVPSQGGRVIPNTTITNAPQYNLTTQSITRPGGLAMEFEAMSMGNR